MKDFIYAGVDPDGIPQSGKITAISQQQAIENLKARNFIVTKLEENSSVPLGDIIAKFRGVPAQEKIVFTRQLGTMINAGLPINQGLRILAEQTENSYFAGVIQDLVQQIDGGASLFDALTSHEKDFGRLYVSLIKAGEASGNLDIILDQLADTMEADSAFKGKVKGAMIYPVIILIVMFLVLGVMFLFVIPQLSALYDDLGAELPAMTKVLIFVSDLFTGYWWLGIGIGVGGYFGMKQLTKNPDVARNLAEANLKAPVFGKLGAQVQLASFTRTLAMLLKSGIPLLEALDIAKETMTNQIFKDALNEAADMVEKGKPLSVAIKHYDIFPALLAEMLAVGEQTGKVDDVLAKISTYFEAQASQKADNLASAIEPIVMVILGTMIGFIVVALIMPIYSLTSSF
ncbi:phytochrome sensor protein [candidate division WWE3 bacterium CG_4_9_14_3_um_filter_41_6]|uniref:Phytochrome sensor protein n=1 Tax=candidate division WWE3 bacterium CG_4_10_14_0_2_um_filter_41_14 TaxID=1975072 RepID=A0A2M7TF53_UNCKA|nr:MAG: phytochrome sensor protein [candidate division WWE3 bacterium CG_4_10_14_0_2_um_filter_41_14]PJA39333.1 MAG: phytochrome sensor protein [candidate division WWE3 bacterium CG_4_9_14_3_um_filter_41_6]